MADAAASLEELLGLVNPLPTPSKSPAHGALVPSGAGDAMAMGAFEATDKMDRAVALWDAPIRSADLEVLLSKDELDGKVADIRRNDALVSGASLFHKDAIVGAVYTLNAQPASSVLFGKVDDGFEAEFSEEIEETFNLFAESPDCWFDAARINTFTELVRLDVGTFFAGGEATSSVEWLSKDSSRPFSTAFMTFDAARLSTPEDQRRYEKDIRAGVKRGPYGQPISYFIRSQHPNDYVSWLLEIPSWKEVPARKPWGRQQIIHIFEQDRPDQTRGIAEIVSALKANRIFHKARDLNLAALATKAMYAAAITSELPSESVFQSVLGAGNMDSKSIAKAITDYSSGYLGAVNRFTDNARNLQVDGVKIPHLYPGTKLEFLSPGKDAPIDDVYERSLLRYLSVAAGMSYEEYSNDYTGTNYSAIKAAIAKGERRTRTKKKLVADRSANMRYRLWLEEHVNSGRCRTVAPYLRRDSTWLYQAGRLDALARAEWIGAHRGQIDELKETQASLLKTKGGLSSLKVECAKLGLDYRIVFRQLAQEQALAKRYDILQQPDPGAKNSLNAASGKPRTKEKPKSNGSADRGRELTDA